MQIFIKGEKPKNLQGATDEKFVIKNRRETPYTKVGPFRPSSPREIGGRLYSGKAWDIMTEKGITPKQIENVINSGEKHRIRETLFYLPKAVSSPSSVTTDLNGRILYVQ